MSHNFKPGNICRIRLKNFLTYDKIELKPTPHLNVLIGPNTTGKSSILCAICLGLAGKPEVTGRGKQISEYVKHGCDLASIEIELYNKKGKNSIIKRCFNAAGKSTWTFNGKDVSQKKIEEGVKLMGICINNLCQFLPQDRVSEFAKLNKIDLLLNTEKAVGETSLAEDHARLSSSTEESLSVRRSIKDLQKQIEAEIKKNDQIIPQVESIRKRKKLLDTIRELRIIRNILKIKAWKSLQSDIGQRRKEVASLIKRLEKRMEPRKKEFLQIDKNLMNMRNQIRERLEHAQKTEKESSQFERKFSHSNSNIENFIQTFANIKNSHAKNLEMIEDLKKQTLVLEQQIRDAPQFDEQKFEAEFQSMTREIQAATKEQSSLSNQIEQNRHEYREHQSLKEAKVRELQATKDVKSRRLKLLLERRQPSFQHAYKATEWLEKNRNLFASAVHGPMFTEIDADPNFARYIEAAIPQRDLIAFVCENKNDVNLLKQKTKQNQMNINIIHSDPSRMSHREPPYPIQHLRKLGFDDYLINQCSAPNAVLAYMIGTHRLDTIPVALREINLEQVPSNISRFYSGNKRVNCQRSRYDGQISTTVDTVGYASFLKVAANSSDIQTIQNHIMQFDESMQRLREVSEQLQQERVNATTYLEDIRKKKQALIEQKDERRHLECRLQQKQSKLARRQESLEDVDEAENAMHRQIKACLVELQKIVNAHCKLQDQLKDLASEDLQATLKHVELNQRKDLLLKESQQEREDLESEKENLTSLEREYAENIEVVKKLSVELSINYKIKENQFEQMLKIHQCNDLDDAETQLAKAEAENECLSSLDDNLVSEFEKRKVAIEELKAKVSSKSKFISNQDKALEETRNRWLPKITELTERIGQHFSSYMEQLDCAGQVVIEKGADENDFSKYGLGIKVKFRDAEKLSDLTLHQQSGGERSVSTALYLLSLQTLTAVPFRCVDEINQGMDATNERNMFRMLIESTSQETASQYFLVTPKLLPNLPFNHRVNFVTVYNGDRMAPYNLFNSKSVIEILKDIEDGSTDYYDSD